MQLQSDKVFSPISLSVVVVPLGESGDLKRCLAALGQQTDVDPFEIVVPYDDRMPNSKLIALQETYGTVRFVPVEGRRTFAELRAVGAHHATGRIIAFTEDHCIPNARWCAQMIESHTGPCAAVGGAVEKAVPDRALNWAFYLADYVRYANPRPAGPSDHLTDCNVSYKRAALEELAQLWQTEFHEPEINGTLRAKNQVLWFSPEAVVHQQRNFRLSEAIQDRYAFGRLFGSGRAATASFSRRIVYAVFALLLPVLLTVRVALLVVKKKRYITPFFRALPFLVMINTLWALGEFLGYTTGRAEASLTPAQSAHAMMHKVT